MSKLQPIQIDENTVIYMEVDDAPQSISPTVSQQEDEEEEQTRTAKGGLNSRSPIPDRAMLQLSAQNLENTIRYYTTYMLNAFKKVAIAEVRQVTLEFGVNMSGAAGIPYIASGTAGCNVKVTVECSFEGAASGEGEATGAGGATNRAEPLSTAPRAASGVASGTASGTANGMLNNTRSAQMPRPGDHRGM